MDWLIKFCAQYLIAVVVLVFLYIFFKIPKNLRRQFLAATLLAVIIAGILDKLASKLYYDPRPFVSQHITPLIAHAPDNGFPSEHTIGAMTLSSVLYFYRRKFAAVAFVLTVIIGAARVAAHVHSPIDILGGVTIGIIAGYTGHRLAQYFLKNKKTTVTEKLKPV